MSQLPDILAQFADVAGEDAALKFAQDFGGTMIYLPMPSYITSEHHLAKSLGTEKARLLCETFGYGYMVVPMAAFANGRKARAIAELADKNKSLTRNEIARRAGTTERHVRRTLNKKPRDKRQYRLFD